MQNRVKITVLKTPTEEEMLAEDYPEEIMKSLFTQQCYLPEKQEYWTESDYCPMPQGFCQYAWRVIFPIVLTVVSGGSRTSKEPALQNILSCPRGIKPTVFKIDLE
jgi:uncharacterized repeat protein (TIGR04076 family)